jgi:hypothetical protein
VPPIQYISLLVKYGAGRSRQDGGGQDGWRIDISPTPVKKNNCK